MPILRRVGLLTLIVALQIVRISHVAAAEPLRPNIIHILTDDLGYGSVGFNAPLGNIQTPNLDNLAGHGMVFNNAYSATLCGPSRAMLYTGFHSGHARLDRNGNIGQGFRAEDVTVAELLHGAGYATGVFGKWGFGASEGTQTSSDKSLDLVINPQITNTATLPFNQGYDEFYGELNHSRAHHYFPSSLWQQNAAATTPIQILTGNVGPGNTNLQVANTHDLVAARSEQFIRDHAASAQPFYLQMNYTIPHNDVDWIEAVPNGQDPYTSRPWSDLQKDYAAMVTRMDASVGSLVQTLADEGLLANTLIVFNSDNGATPELGGSVDENGTTPGNTSPANPVNFHHANGPFRGGKRDLFEGGIHLPMFAYWVDENGASRLSASQTNRMTDLADFLPTAAELAGVRTPVGVDGLSLAPTLLNGAGGLQRDYLIFEHHEENSGLPGVDASIAARWAIIRNGVKLIKYDNGTQQMFDLAADVNEANDLLAGTPSAARLQLRDQLQAIALAEGVEREDAYSVEYQTWTGGNNDQFLNAAKWTGSTTGQPAENWSATLVNHAASPSVVLADVGGATLGLEVASATASQTLRVASGQTLSGRNEVRISAGGRVQLDNATLATNRWINILPGGVLSGQGSVQGYVANAGLVAPGLPADLTASSGGGNVNTGVVPALAFNFSGVQDTSPLTQTSLRNANLQLVSGLAFGPGLAPRNAANAGNEFNVQGFLNKNVASSSLADAIVASDYLTFTVAPIAGVAMKLDSVSVSFWRNGVNAAQDYAILTSLAPFTAGNQIGLLEDVSDFGSSAVHQLTGAYQGAQSTISPIEIRIYGWDATGNSGNTHFNAVSMKASFTSLPAVPLDPTGILTLPGDYTQDHDGRLDLEIGGVDNSNAAAAQYDQLRVSGDVRLAGGLTLKLVDGYAPTVGASVDLVLADGVTGSFDRIVGAATGNGFVWSIQYQADRVRAVAQPLLSGDFDRSGRVDGVDFLAWQRYAGAASVATLAEGDGDGDGDVDATDLGLWRSGFAASANAAGHQVPEPTAAIATFCGLFCAVPLARNLRSRR